MHETSQPATCPQSSQALSVLNRSRMDVMLSDELGSTDARRRCIMPINLNVACAKSNLYPPRAS